MGRYGFLIAMLLLMASCEYPSQKINKNKKAANVIYAHTVLYTANMDVIPVRRLSSDKIKETKVLKIEYDKKKRPIKIQWMYMGKPALADPPNQKIHSFGFTYEKNKITQTIYSKKNYPTFDVYGISKIVTQLDENNFAIRRSYYGIDGKLIHDEYGNYQYKYEKSENDNQFYGYTLDTNGNITASAEGGFRYRFSVDSNNVIIKNEWLDENNTLTLNNNQYAISELEYDELYQFTSISYRDTALYLTLNKGNNTATTLYKYDQYGNIIELSFYGLYGQAVTNSHFTCSKLKISYKKGDAYQAIAYDTEGNRIN